MKRTGPLADFVDRLRLARLAARVQQQHLAERLEMGQSRLASYESHKHEPDTETLTRWADALGVEVPEGLTGRIDPVAQCGTTSGRATHRKRGEPVCEPCKQAWRDYMNEYRRRAS